MSYNPDIRSLVDDPSLSTMRVATITQMMGGFKVFYQNNLYLFVLVRISSGKCEVGAP
jgi:hypothetical protein